MAIDKIEPVHYRIDVKEGRLVCVSNILSSLGRYLKITIHESYKIVDQLIILNPLLINTKEEYFEQEFTFLKLHI